MQPISKNTASPSSSSAFNSATGKKFWPLAATVSVLAVGVWTYRCQTIPPLHSQSAVSTEPTATPAATPEPVVRAKKLSYRVVGSFPHDPGAFTQGLLWHEGGFYESTGLNGRSSLRRVEFPSGRVLKKVNVAPQFFAEGLALAGEKLYQLTWQSKVGFIYDRKTFKRLNTFSYGTEGWGLTYDGKHLILSDGTPTLYFINPADFKVVRRVDVTLDSNPVAELNELEWINGKIWANVWQTDQILIINPEDGVVSGSLDMTGLLPTSQRRGGEDVLNGIAHDAKTGRIFITGKLWPKIFQIELEK